MMKTDFTIHVNVSLGVTPELARCIGFLAGCAGKQGREEAPASEEPGEAPQPALPAEPEVPAKEPSVEDVREAMHHARRRIEGEDYRENTGSEAYQKWHRPLTGWFKRQAGLLCGTELPSALPPDKREDFIRICDRTEVLPDGTIGLKEAF